MERRRSTQRPVSSASFIMDEMVQSACQISGPTDHFRLSSCDACEHETGHGEDDEDDDEENVGPLGEAMPSRKWSPPFVHRGQRPRPLITLRYMQTIDGCVSMPEKSCLPDLQQKVSPNGVRGSVDTADVSVVQFVNRLRSNHDAILVGSNTILRDDPCLSSGSQSRQPQPVILDSELQCKLASHVMENQKKPWIFCATGLEQDPRKAELEAAGIRVFHAPVDPVTKFLNLEDVLQMLYEDLDIQKIAVEGGVRVLESFIRSGLFDKLVIIMAPCFGVGRALFQAPGEDSLAQELQVKRASLPSLTNIRYDVLGMDLVMTAEPVVVPADTQMG